MRTFLLALFLFSANQVTSQEYQYIDSIVNQYPKKFKSIENFAYEVSLDFKSNIERTRAVYYWISNNITYDYKSLRKKRKKKKIKFKSRSEYEAKVNKLNRKIAEKTLRNKSAVCEGYSRLLTEVLKDLNVISVVVTGYAKQLPNEIGRIRRNSNHAWNAVKIKGDWFLIDATWSTGNSIYNSNFFNFSDTYFLMPPDAMILSHFPDDEQWQLQKKPISKTDYFNLPIYYTAYHSSGLKLKDNFSGLITTKTGSTIQLDFTKIDENKTYYYSFDKGKSGEIKFKNEDDIYKLLIPYEDKRRKNLLISDGQLGLIKFKIKLIKD